MCLEFSLVQFVLSPYEIVDSLFSHLCFFNLLSVVAFLLPVLL